MYNGTFDANTLAQYSLNLLRGQMITQLIGGQAINGLSLTDFILGRSQPKKRSGTDIMNDALSGLMRSDAAGLRQGSKNLDHAKALMQTGAAALKDISASTGRMREIVSSLTGMADGAEKDALKAEYLSLSGKITSSIEGTRFNGINVLDGTDWASYESITLNGETGKLSLHAGGAPGELTLYDLKTYKNAFTAADLLDDTTLGVTASSLEQFSGLVERMTESYEARAALLGSESASLQRRADILDEATGRAKPGDEGSLRDILVDILMRDSGSVLDGSS